MQEQIKLLTVSLSVYSTMEDETEGADECSSGGVVPLLALTLLHLPRADLWYKPIQPILTLFHSSLLHSSKNTIASLCPAVFNPEQCHDSLINIFVASTIGNSGLTISLIC